ncbi:uncharacterized protein DS421_13g390990 [Arachis hypogaea]|nr:uncharacterized protein DS421_13g390990 [Arachis hypogaea]
MIDCLPSPHQFLAFSHSKSSWIWGWTSQKSPATFSINESHAERHAYAWVTRAHQLSSSQVTCMRKVTRTRHLNFAIVIRTRHVTRTRHDLLLQISILRVSSTFACFIFIL